MYINLPEGLGGYHYLSARSCAIVGLITVGLARCCPSVLDKFVACVNHAAPLGIDVSSGIAGGMNLGRSQSPSRAQYKIFHATGLALHPKFRSAPPRLQHHSRTLLHMHNPLLCARN